MISCKQTAGDECLGRCFWEGGCLKKNVSLERRDTTEFVWSCAATSPAPRSNLPSIPWGKKLCQNGSAEVMELFLVPQMLDFTLSCRQHLCLPSQPSLISAQRAFKG